GRWSWPPSRRCGTGCSEPPGPRSATSPPRPTPPMPWGGWPGGTGGREPGPGARSSCGGARARPAGGTGARARRGRSPRAGRGGRGEACERAGYGPGAVAAIRDLIDTGDPFLAAVVTKGEKVVGVAHLGRRANASQQSALEWLYPTCAAEGCSSLAWLQND